MSRKFFVYLTLAAFSAGSVGCSATRPAVRGRDAEGRAEKGPLRRRIGRNIDDAKPALEATKKGVAVGAMLALLGGLWYLGHTAGAATGDDP